MNRITATTAVEVVRVLIVYLPWQAPTLRTQHRQDNPVPTSATLLRNRDLTLVLAALKKTMEISDGYDPHRNPARCMRQIRTLLSRMELREAVRHLENDLLLLAS
jgi:tRNA C32,U32 (ribose-2'-O)-methylase TrmJ